MSDYGTWLTFRSSTGGEASSYFAGPVRRRSSRHLPPFFLFGTPVTGSGIGTIGWFANLSEPVRFKPRHYWRDHFNRNASWHNLITQKLTGWYQPFSEPVRRKAPLPRGAVPFLFVGAGYAEYHFTLTETGDTATLTYAQYVPKNLARVSIVEIAFDDTSEVAMGEVPYHAGADVTIMEVESYTARVTIREINYSRGYY